MRTALLVFSILAILLNVFSTLLSVIFLMAGSPNSSPQQLTFLQRMMMAFGAVGLICLVVAIILSARGVFNWSIAASLVPVVFAIAFFTWAFIAKV